MITLRNRPYLVLHPLFFYNTLDQNHIQGPAGASSPDGQGISPFDLRRGGCIQAVQDAVDGGSAWITSFQGRNVLPGLIFLQPAKRSSDRKFFVEIETICVAFSAIIGIGKCGGG